MPIVAASAIIELCLWRADVDVDVDVDARADHVRIFQEISFERRIGGGSTALLMGDFFLIRDACQACSWARIVVVEIFILFFVSVEGRRIFR